MRLEEERLEEESKEREKENIAKLKAKVGPEHLVVRENWWQSQSNKKTETAQHLDVLIMLGCA
jgi:hypothetical protein